MSSARSTHPLCSTVTSKFNELVYQYPIRIPERYSLVIRWVQVAWLVLAGWLVQAGWVQAGRLVIADGGERIGCGGLWGGGGGVPFCAARDPPGRAWLVPPSTPAPACPAQPALPASQPPLSVAVSSQPCPPLHTLPVPPPASCRSLLTQEGICLTLDPDFHFLEVGPGAACYG